MWIMRMEWALLWDVSGKDTVYDYKFVGLSHNTVRGAAGGAILCAEALKALGYIAAKMKEESFTG